MIFGKHIGNNDKPDLYIKFENYDSHSEKVLANIEFEKLFKKIDKLQKKRGVVNE